MWRWALTSSSSSSSSSSYSSFLSLFFPFLSSPPPPPPLLLFCGKAFAFFVRFPVIQVNILATGESAQARTYLFILQLKHTCGSCFFSYLSMSMNFFPSFFFPFSLVFSLAIFYLLLVVSLLALFGV